MVIFRTRWDVISCSLSYNRTAAQIIWWSELRGEHSLSNLHALNCTVGFFWGGSYVPDNFNMVYEFCKISG